LYALNVRYKKKSIPRLVHKQVFTSNINKAIKFLVGICVYHCHIYIHINFCVVYQFCTKHMHICIINTALSDRHCKHLVWSLNNWMGLMATLIIANFFMSGNIMSFVCLAIFRLSSSHIIDDAHSPNQQLFFL
jgi:hypothetical protein